MAQTLYITDLDGTLLDPSARVTETSRRLLNEAIKTGAMFTVATARTPATVDVLMRDIDMRLPGIVVTGAAMWNFKTCKFSNTHYLSPGNVDILNDIFNSSDVVPFVYTLDSDNDNLMHVYYSRANAEGPDAGFIAARKELSLKRFHLGERLPDSRRADVILFFGSGRSAEIRRIASGISVLTDCSISCYDDIYNPGTALIEVFAPGVSKGAAMDILRQQTGADRVVVFGDNLNDLGMFDHADVSVAVGNALPEVRAAADLVIDANTDDAVARFILDSINRR